MAGVQAAEQADASSRLVEYLADLILNPSSWDASIFVEPLLDQISAGINEETLSVVSPFLSTRSARFPTTIGCCRSSGGNVSRPSPKLLGLLRAMTGPGRCRRAYSACWRVLGGGRPPEIPLTLSTGCPTAASGNGSGRWCSRTPRPPKRVSSPMR